jgi:hypothetical protein
MVDGTSRKRKLADGHEEPVGTSRHVDAVDSLRGRDLLAKGPDGSARCVNCYRVATADVAVTHLSLPTPVC